MLLTTMDQLIETHRSPRLYFAGKMKEKDEIKRWLDTHLSTVNEYVGTFTPTDGSSFFGVTTTRPDFVYLLRTSRRGLQYVHHYDSAHLRNSIIANVVLNENLSEKDRMSTTSWLWYYFWFMRSEDNINNLTHNVCYEIEEMIKLILLKENRLYKDTNTREAVQLLRGKLRSEGIVNLTNRSKGINFRR